MDLEFSPGILDTPSLMTPNIGANSLIFKSSYINNDNNSIPNPSSTTTNDESFTVTSEIKVSKIEHDLKQSFTQPRKPTESPFQRMVEVGALTIDKNVSMPSVSDEIPSTAEVMNVLESFAKNLAKDNVEQDITTTLSSDINRLDTSMVVNVSPKKKLLYRSQSHTEPTSPTSIPTNNFSQSQKLNSDDDNSNDDHHFQRLHDLPIISHTTDSNQQIDIKPTFTIQSRPEQTIIKQQQIIINNNIKRPFPQAIVGNSIPKANSILIPQNEVTSSSQLSGIKRQKMTPIPANVSLRSTTRDDHIGGGGGGGDDQRKKQIRESNREAARRCRERRRVYIEQLEGNLEQCKLQIKTLNEKLARAERENTQLHAIITETKIFHPSSRLSSNEAIVDFGNMGTNGIENNSENNGNTLQRNYINRNTH